MSEDVCVMRYQVKDKVTSLLQLHEQLQSMWQKRSEYLQQLHNQHALIHEAHQPGNLSTSQEVSQSTSLYTSNCPLKIIIHTSYYKHDWFVWAIKENY